MTHLGAIIAGPALNREPGESPYPIIGGPPLPAPSGAQARPRLPGRPRAAARSGEFVLWLHGRPPAALSPEAGDNEVPGGAGAEDVSAVGLCAWSFVAPSDEAKQVHRDLHPHVPVPRGAAEWGYIQYTLQQVWRLEEPPPKVDIGVPRNDPVAPSLVWNAVREHAVTTGGTVANVLKPFPDHAMGILFLLPHLWSIIFSGVPTVAWPVRLATRMAVDLTIHNIPSRSTLRSWRRLEGVQRQRRDARRGREEPKTPEDMLLELPTAHKRRRLAEPGVQRRRGKTAIEIDPVHLMNAVFFHGSCAALGTSRRLCKRPLRTRTRTSMRRRGTPVKTLAGVRSTRQIAKLILLIC